MDRLDLYTSIVPSERQIEVQRDGFNVFIHYGLNTFTGKEWGDGKVPASMFNPTRQNTDQWVETIKNTGAKSIILTAKHHDGFCMWQTKTTDYSVKNSPYKNGKGDVVREVANSCKKYGMKFGVYLSPWDRNHKDYATPQYNDVYVEQLTELLTQYGDISYVWLDGACGSYMDGKEKQVYDFERYFALIRKLQPNALISNCGPDIRWVGNEGGFARESEWNVVPAFSFDLQTIERNSQQADDGEFAKRGSDIVASDLGSR
ncbi:MAG: alpha-L-fucosidase, partial [Oscillospiraceae bacterium]